MAGTGLVTAVPGRLTRRMSGAAGVTVSEPPARVAGLAGVAWWHPLRAAGPALGWLRAIAREAAGC